MGDSCLTLALAPSYDSPLSLAFDLVVRGEFLTADFSRGADEKKDAGSGGRKLTHPFCTRKKCLEPVFFLSDKLKGALDLSVLIALKFLFSVLGMRCAEFWRKEKNKERKIKLEQMMKHRFLINIFNMRVREINDSVL